MNCATFHQLVAVHKADLDHGEAGDALVEHTLKRRLHDVRILGQLRGDLQVVGIGVAGVPTAHRVNDRGWNVSHARRDLYAGLELATVDRGQLKLMVTRTLNGGTGHRVDSDCGINVDHRRTLERAEAEFDRNENARLTDAAKNLVRVVKGNIHRWVIVVLGKVHDLTRHDRHDSQLGAARE